VAVNVNINGTSYTIPSTGEEGWGDEVTNWIVAASSFLLQRSGGSFPLSAEVDFGATAGLRALIYRSKAADVAASGVLRLGNADKISFRNAANSADLQLGTNASNQLVFNGVTVPLSGLIVNADVAPAAGIVYSKLDLANAVKASDIDSEASTNGHVLTADGSGGAAFLAPGASVAITALTGDVTATGPGSAVASIAATTVTGKLITGFVSGAGTVSATDTILQAINKLDGNVAAAASNTISNAFYNSLLAFQQLGDRTAVGSNPVVASVRYAVDMWPAVVQLTDGTFTSLVDLTQEEGVLDGSVNSIRLNVYQNDQIAAETTSRLELYGVLSNRDSMPFYNKSACASLQVKARGNVNQVGIQFMYKTTEGLPDTTIGSEVLVSVNSASHSLVSVVNQALGTAMTKAGNVGVRLRVTGVSSGRVGDVGNGLDVEQPLMHVGAVLGTFTPHGDSVEQEAEECLAFLEKSYEYGVDLATNTLVGAAFGVAATGNNAYLYLRFNHVKRTTPTVTLYTPAGTVNNFRDITSNTDVAANSPEVTRGSLYASAPVTANNSFGVHFVANSLIVQEV